MATRNLEKNQNTISKALDRNLERAERAIENKYKIALAEIQSELMDIVVKYNKIDNETLSKFNRREKLIKNLNGILNELFGSVRRITRRLVDIEYKQSYFRHAWAIDQNIGVELKWNLRK